MNDPIDLLQQSPRRKAEEAYNVARQDADTYAIFSDLIKRQELISGKTISEWKELFSIDIPESPDPQLCKEIDMKLMALHHEATFHFNLARMCLDAATMSSEATFRKKFSTLVQESKIGKGKVPAAATLETLARADQESIERLRESAKRDVSFWKTIMADLDMQRKLVNDATMNNGIQVKLDMYNSSGNIPNTPTRED